MDIEDIIRKVKNKKPELLETNRKYSVLIPLIRKGHDWEIIYELRAKDMSRQPGEISFPGGQVEEGEGYDEAAIRETMEELNISRDNIDLIGELDFLVSQSNNMIRTYLAIIKDVDIDRISPNKDEVDHIFTVPVEFFVNTEPKLHLIQLKASLNEDFPYSLIPNGRDYDWEFGEYPVYFYDYEGYIIWGFTAKMTKYFIDLIK